MSRSYKKHPFCKDGNRSSKESKKVANGIIRAKNKRAINGGTRKRDDIPTRSKGAYRKAYSSYDINDYILRETEEESKRWWEENSVLHDPSFGGHRTFEDYQRRWEKLYKRK